VAGVTGDVPAVLEARVADREPAVAGRGERGGRGLQLADGPRGRPVGVGVPVGALRAHRARTEVDLLVVPEQVLPGGGSGHPVHADPGVRLEGADRGGGGRAEVAVHGQAGAALGVELVLQGLHGGAVVALPDGEDQRAPGGGADDAVRAQTLGLLERHDRAVGARAEDAVRGHRTAVRREQVLEGDDVGAPAAARGEGVRGLGEGLGRDAGAEEQPGERGEQGGEVTESLHG
jgi:hypothetical protein